MFVAMVTASLVLVLATSGLVNSKGIPAGPVNASPRCCFADQYHGTILMGVTVIPQTGPPSLQTITEEFDADYTAQRDRQVLHGTILEADVNYTLTYLADYKTKKRYTIAEDGNCTVIDFTVPQMGPCISDFLTYGGVKEIGSQNNKIMAQVWSGKVDIYEMTMLTTPDDCTLISQSVYMPTIPGDPNTRAFFGSTFTDMVQGSLRKPDILDIPSQCPQEDAMTVDVV